MSTQASLSIIPFRVGTRVRHMQHGLGTVTALPQGVERNRHVHRDDREITVRFDTGATLSLRWLNHRNQMGEVK